MDLVSSYSVQIRNRCKIVSPINIMQFNRDSGNQERMKQNLMDPTSNDFKDSGAINFIKFYLVGSLIFCIFVS